MIQVNLIPDIKRQYLQSRRLRNLTTSISILAGLGAVALVVIAGIILLLQVGREALADNAIKSEYEKLAAVEDLGELVTIQNQLTLLPAQHKNRSVDSRLFTVMEAINPAPPNDVSFTSVKLDPEAGLIVFEGLAKAGYPAVEAFKKTILNTKFEYAEFDDLSQMVEVPLAEVVEEGETSYGETSSGDRVLRFSLTMQYAPSLFSNQAQQAKIVTPTKKIDVTDSKIRVPDSLFSSPADEAEE
ncbi:hypothetical protein CR983_00480 [Candidatus Saccharibacteria bacterium]|nr:MAG: hypothetical protein CR983_00480 [Candidatus Saccharibacteria bacterium]